jgi:hypothetical protein
MSQLIVLSIVPTNSCSLQLSQAYETLRDAVKRREYDLIYPSIRLRKASSQNTQTPRSPPPCLQSPPTPSPQPPPPTSASSSETDNEVARIAALRKEKEERGAQWRVKRDAFESSISELRRTIRRLEQDITNLAGVTAAEKGTEAHQGRKSQERQIEQDLKERRLTLQKAQLLEKENGMKQAKDEIDAADLHNDNAIRIIEAKIEARARSKEAHDRRQREATERERRENLRQQQQQQQQQEQREKDAKTRRQQEEQREKDGRAAEFARQEEVRRQERLRRNNAAHPHVNHNSTHQPHASATCDHNGGWEKVVHRKPCPECHDVWNYMLQCPGCKIEACARCQADIRPLHQRRTERTTQREAPRPRSPSND